MGMAVAVVADVVMMVMVVINLSFLCSGLHDDRANHHGRYEIHHKQSS